MPVPGGDALTPRGRDLGEWLNEANAIRAENAVLRQDLRAAQRQLTEQTAVLRQQLADSEEQVRLLRTYIRFKCPHHTIGSAPPCYCAEALAALDRRTKNKGDNHATSNTD